MKMVELNEQLLLDLLKEAPRTANEIAKIVGSHHFTVYKALMRLMLKDKPIRVKKIGRYEIFWYDFFGLHMKRVAKEMYGDSLTEADLILVDLLEKKAFNKESSVPIENYNPELISGHIKEKRVTSEDGRVYLTEIGRKIAEGLKEIWKSKNSKVVLSLSSATRK
ncbi:MAG: hypothetical protein J7L47_10015 [Candidatus Odinarchaeota archaeon]|nr:hypothetical protein [Candidatus Odinarchaeota archaeon]